MDRNSTFVSIFVSLCVAAVALGGLNSCDSKREQDTKRLTTCVQSGGQWIEGGSGRGSNCIAPREK